MQRGLIATFFTNQLVFQVQNHSIYLKSAYRNLDPDLETGLETSYFKIMQIQYGFTKMVHGSIWIKRQTGREVYDQGHSAEK